MSVGGECLAPCLLQVYILPEVVDSPLEPCRQAAAREPETSRSRARLLLHGVFYFGWLFFWFLVFPPIFTSLMF